ncbi:MAG: hypothetical protein PHP98_00070 [Kiritimatiellae bacterium]|nr:hypothetical protein [Kiritimatiellia bacterium]
MKTQDITFGEDLAFLRDHVETVVLKDSAGKAQAVVSPSLQGRVLTSSADGEHGLSFGWINRALIASGKIEEHINAYGGEDRFWLGPEGGQYSVFFAKGAPFDLDHCFVPAPIDTDPFPLLSRTGSRARMTKDIQLVNYSGASFSLRADREIEVLEREEALRLLGVEPPAAVKSVAYQSVNKISNTGNQAWTKESGLLSIWIVGMFPARSATVILPFIPGPETNLGPLVNDAYFGKVPSDRLRLGQNVLFFKGDGQRRSKIGLSPRRARPVLGSYDAEHQALTIVHYTKPGGMPDYVNSMWEIQKEPYCGDTVHSYNDGPAKPGSSALGPFYELETSSPAAALSPRASCEHIHRTFHLQGAEKDLDPVSRAVLGASLDEIKKAF